MAKPPVKKELSNLHKAWANLQKLPLFEYYYFSFPLPCEMGKGWAYISSTGFVKVNINHKKFGTVKEWEWVLAVLLVSLGLNSKTEELSELEQDALMIDARRFVETAKIGQVPQDFRQDLLFWPRKSWTGLVAWAKSCSPDDIEKNKPLRLCGHGEDVRFTAPSSYTRPATSFPKQLGRGIAKAAASAVSLISGDIDEDSVIVKAKKWFIENYPLLGATVSAFDIVEDYRECEKYDIAIAAVSPYSGEIYFNTRQTLSVENWKFVMAHEIFHVAFDHLPRRKGRDPYLWNLACDFVVNSWVIDLRIGEAPSLGLLYDKEMNGKSCEEVYDIIAKESRKYRKLACMSGRTSTDMLEKDGFSKVSDVVKAGLLRGYEMHKSLGRGLLPAGLEEEIRVIATPPIPWDTALANWMSARFTPDEKRKTYGRHSRRQSATDIPLPGRIMEDVDRPAKVLGVVLDTSGSMDKVMLGRAIGAVASTCLSLDVDFIRLIWCDAAAFDEGWKTPETLTLKISVKGRGGTQLQAGLNELRRLESIKDFPGGAPVLIITDGWCESHLDSCGFDTAALVVEGGPTPTGVNSVFILKK